MRTGIEVLRFTGKYYHMLSVSHAPLDFPTFCNHENSYRKPWQFGGALRNATECHATNVCLLSPKHTITYSILHIQLARSAK